MARSAIVHLLNRTEFAARPERVDALSALTLEQAVDDILAADPTPVDVPSGLRVRSTSRSNEQYKQACRWWFERMARRSPRPFQEKMTLFWHSHFSCEWSVVHNSKLMMQQNQLLRQQAFGNFRTMLHGVAVDPAMLIYLDNMLNVMTSPNQNFGRELLELFTVGYGNYTEADVESSSAAWTGHGVRGDDYQFFPDLHDATERTFMGRTGTFDGPDIIDMLLDVSTRVRTGPNTNIPTEIVTARHLTRKLWEFLAYENPEHLLVSQLADVLVDHEFEITPWLRAMLLRDEFYSTRAREGLIRQPADYIASLLYHSGVSADSVFPEWAAHAMGQGLFRPPNVGGWGGNDSWIHAGAFAARSSFAERVRHQLAVRNRSSSLRLTNGEWNWRDLDNLEPSVMFDTLAGGFGVELTERSRETFVEWAATERVVDVLDNSRPQNALLLVLLAPEMSRA